MVRWALIMRLTSAAGYAAARPTTAVASSPIATRTSTSVIPFSVCRATDDPSPPGCVALAWDMAFTVANGAPPSRTADALRGARPGAG